MFFFSLFELYSTLGNNWKFTKKLSLRPFSTDQVRVKVMMVKKIAKEPKQIKRENKNDRSFKLNANIKIFIYIFMTLWFNESDFMCIFIWACTLLHTFGLRSNSFFYIFLKFTERCLRIHGWWNFIYNFGPMNQRLLSE